MSIEAFDAQSLKTLRHLLSWLFLSHLPRLEEITLRDKSAEVPVMDALCDSDKETLDREGLRHQIGTDPENGAPFWLLFWGDQLIGSIRAKADRRGWGRLATDLDLEEHYFEPSRDGFELVSFCGSTKHINNALVLMTDQPASALTCKTCRRYAPKVSGNQRKVNQGTARSATWRLPPQCGDPTMTTKIKNLKTLFKHFEKTKEKSNGPDYGTTLIVGFFNLLFFYLLWSFWKNH